MSTNQYKSDNVGIGTDYDQLPAPIPIGAQKEFNDAYKKWAKKNGLEPKLNKGGRPRKAFNYGSRGQLMWTRGKHKHTYRRPYLRKGKGSRGGLRKERESKHKAINLLKLNEVIDRIGKLPSEVKNMKNKFYRDLLAHREYLLDG